MTGKASSRGDGTAGRAAGGRTGARRLTGILAAVALTGGLAACTINVNNPATPTHESGTAPTVFSRLDEAGVAEIKATGSVRLDLSAGMLAKSDVGLAPDSYTPDLKAPNGGIFDLEITGPAGVLNAKTDRVRFTTTDTSSDIDPIYYFLTATSLEEYAQLLRDGVQDYGLDADATERWISGAESDPAKKSSYSLGDGSALGINVGYDLRYDGSKETQVVIVTVSARP